MKEHIYKKSGKGYFTFPFFSLSMQMNFKISELLPCEIWKIGKVVCKLKRRNFNGRKAVHVVVDHCLFVIVKDQQNLVKNIDSFP